VAATSTGLNSLKPLPPDISADQRDESLIRRLFISPTVVILLALSIFPLIWSLGISFTDYERATATRAASATEPTGFLGLGFNLTLRNYTQMLGDERLFITARNTMLYVVGGVSIQYVIGFGLALLLHQEFFGRRFFRIVFLLPMMVTPVAAGYVGRMMFDSSLSPLAQFLRTIGTFWGNLTGQPNLQLVAPWITDGSWAPVTMMLIDSWQWIPFMTLILLAGLQGIPEEIYEAARVDGANTWAIFWRITFPIMLPITFTAIIIRALETFKIIDIIRVTTGGGPGTSTESLVMYVYTTALTSGNYSYAAAISYVLMVLVVIFSTAFLGFSRRVVKQQLG
jgi:multiple sugar transport system permease protein